MNAMFGEVTYDWLSKILYWSDVYGNKISAVKLADDFDPQTNTTIVENLLSPRTLAVAPLDG